ncbi:MAG TPA: hypothetical protein VFJ72_07930 [Rubrobacteraceae bacterium]|nr:hypothetical protein [Rubrobacteraceae bacterium]
MILLRAWLLHVVLVATLFSAELLFGAPDWSSGNAGTFTFGLLFSCPLGFWSSLTVMIEGGSENASRDRMSLMLSTLGLQLGGFVVGVLVGLALTVYLISPLIRYVEG